MSQQTSGWGTGEGASIEGAVTVASVAEEYEWIEEHYPGFEVQLQWLRQSGGRFYDGLKLEDAAGNQLTIYFDISSFQGQF